MNNNTAIPTITITSPSYSIKTVSLAVRCSETKGKVEVTVTVNGVQYGDSQTYNTKTGSGTYGTLTFTGTTAQTGDVVISFANKCGGGTGCGTFYVNSVTLTEGAAATPAPVAPTVDATATATGIRVTWGDVANATSYLVQIATDNQFTATSAGGTTTLHSNDPTTTSSLDAGGWTRGGTMYDKTASSVTYVLMQSDGSILSPAITTAGYTSLSADYKAGTFGTINANQADTTVCLVDGTTGAVIANTAVTQSPSGSSLVDAETVTWQSSAYVGHTTVKVKWTTPNSTITSASGTAGARLKGFTVKGTGTAVEGSIVDESDPEVANGVQQYSATLAAGSQSVSEFWKRWHITLGSWMMDYLYIPLGGNRKGKGRTYLNLWIVFFLSGLWHGAAWTFVAWGAFHGLFIVIDKMFWLKASKRIGKLPRVLITFVIVMVGWVLFRADTFGYAVQYVGAMFGANGSTPALFVNTQFTVTLIVAALFSFFGLTKAGDRALDFFFNRKAYNTWQVIGVGLLMVVLLVLSASFILKGSFNPFIYFRF